MVGPVTVYHCLFTGAAYCPFDTLKTVNITITGTEVAVFQMTVSCLDATLQLTTF
jgi:hypothetical protein